MTEEQLAEQVEQFYARARVDALLGPVFDDAVEDWPHHLGRIQAFWSSVMLTSGRYKGSPVAAHLKHGARLTPEMFVRWLALWRETAAEVFPPGEAEAIAEKAEKIGEGLSLALFLRL
ncbi:group III truncated hemoglobin [Sphingomonas sp. DT-207]|uniref:group III truncated hemoglobin n=1 Tax=Sphingomonas sp. DT-207 TaxID=3396167 RepID=UPI003F1CDF5B